jgi:hypothetical protein
VLLWLAAIFWLFSGTSGLIQFVEAIPLLARASVPLLTFIVVALISHLLSVWGAIQLLRRKWSAIPILLAVVVLYIGAVFFTHPSPTTWGAFTYSMLATAVATIAYAAWLRWRGMLT